MAEIHIRPASRGDLAKLTEIYNHHVLHTPVTFDIEPYTLERRSLWFDQFAEIGRYRLLVAEENGEVVAYAGTTRFRPKAAYETTVEATIYCTPNATGRGIGSRLYAELFAAIAHEDIHRIVAGFTLPNAATKHCTNASDFGPSAFSMKTGANLAAIGACAGRSARFGSQRMRMEASCYGFFFLNRPPS